MGHTLNDDVCNSGFDALVVLAILSNLPSGRVWNRRPHMINRIKNINSDKIYPA